MVIYGCIYLEFRHWPCRDVCEVFKPALGMESSGIPLFRGPALLRASCKFRTKCTATKPHSLNWRRWRWKCSRQFIKYWISSHVTTALLATSFITAYSRVNSFPILWETTSGLVYKVNHMHYGKPLCFWTADLCSIKTLSIQRDTSSL